MSDDCGTTDTYDSTSYSCDTSDQNTYTCDTTTTHDYSSSGHNDNDNSGGHSSTYHVTSSKHNDNDNSGGYSSTYHVTSSKDNDNYNSGRHTTSESPERTYRLTSSKDSDNDNSGRHTSCEAPEKTYRFTPSKDNDNDNRRRHSTTEATYTERANDSTSSHKKNHTPILERTYPGICSSSSNEAVDSDDVTRECIDSEPRYIYDTRDADYTSVAFDDFDSESIDTRKNGSSRLKRNNLIKEKNTGNKKESQDEDKDCCKCWSKSWKCLATFCDCFGL